MSRISTLLVLILTLALAGGASAANRKIGHLKRAKPLKNPRSSRRYVGPRMMVGGLVRARAPMFRRYPFGRRGNGYSVQGFGAQAGTTTYVYSPTQAYRGGRVYSPRRPAAPRPALKATPKPAEAEVAPPAPVKARVAAAPKPAPRARPAPQGLRSPRRPLVALALSSAYAD